MKNNTIDVKIFLQKAYASTPNDNSLSEVKSLIRMALNKIESVESKREKRQDNKEKRESKNPAFQNPELMLRLIDQEISKTKSNLNEIKNKKIKVQDKIDDSDDISTVFG
jgi:hypothetical protein